MSTCTYAGVATPLYNSIVPSCEVSTCTYAGVATFEARTHTLLGFCVHLYIRGSCNTVEGDEHPAIKSVHLYIRGSCNVSREMMQAKLNECPPVHTRELQPLSMPFGVYLDYGVHLYIRGSCNFFILVIPTRHFKCPPVHTRELQQASSVLFLTTDAPCPPVHTRELQQANNKSCDIP